MKPTVRSFFSDAEWDRARPYVNLLKEKKDDVAFAAGVVLDLYEVFQEEGWADWIAVPLILIIGAGHAEPLAARHAEEFTTLVATMLPWMERTNVTKSNPLEDDGHATH